MRGLVHQHDGNSWSPHGTALYEELVHHLPFSVSAVAIGLAVAGIICYLTPIRLGPAARSESEQHGAPGDSAPAGEPVVNGGVTDAHDSEEHAADEHRHENPFMDLFHLFHPMHMLFSAAATTAMFWRYERRVVKALIIGLVGAIGVCGLSDIVMPHLSLRMLGKQVPWHVCVIETPSMVLSFAAVGVVVGLAASQGVRRSTFFSHSLHVFSSTMASIFYLIGPFGQHGWIDSIGVVFLFIILAVMVPCCLSDIVFPLFLAGRARDQYHDEVCGCGAEGHARSAGGA